MEDIKLLLNLLLAALYLMGVGVVWWKIAHYIGGKLHFAELFLCIVRQLRHK